MSVRMARGVEGASSWEMHQIGGPLGGGVGVPMEEGVAALPLGVHQLGGTGGGMDNADVGRRDRGPSREIHQLGVLVGDDRRWS